VVATSPAVGISDCSVAMFWIFFFWTPAIVKELAASSVMMQEIISIYR
jgi:hypothetical protein